MSLKYAIVLALLVTCEMFFIRFGVRAGTGELDSRFLIQGLIGVIPLLILRDEKRHAYWSFAALMIGSAGLLLLSLSFIGACEEGDVFCVLHGDRLTLGLAFAYYLGFLALGQIGLMMASRALRQLEP